MTRVPAARAATAAAVTVCTGISSWATRTSAALTVANSSSVRPTSASLAPGVTMMAFSPCALTMTSATPDVP